MTAAPASPVPAPAKIQVRKRSGKLVDYQKHKIEQVVKLCLVNGCSWDAEDPKTDTVAARVATKVDDVIRSMPNVPVSVETIQDLVAVYLEVDDASAAQSFRSYREEHRKLRLEQQGIFAPRTAFKPFEYPHFIKFVDAINHSYWVHTEWNFIADVHHFKTALMPHERHAIKNALLAISQIEVAVKKFWGNIGERFPKPEISAVGDTFAESEVRHSRAYSHLLEVLDLNADFEELLKVPAIRARVDYLNKSLKADDDEKKDYSLKVALFSMFIENCSLFSQFAVIKSFTKHRSMLKDVNNVIQATMREEQLHAMFGAALINEVKNERPEWFDDTFRAKLVSAARDAYDAEAKIIDWMFEEGELEFLSAATLKEFVKDRINQSFDMIDVKPVFEIDEELLEPLEWFDEELHLGVSIDFFHTKSTDYTKFSQSYAARDIIRDVKPIQACGMVAPPKIVLDAVRDVKDMWWNNEASQAVLDSDYLLPGTNTEQRIHQMAMRAAELNDEPGVMQHAKRFEKYMRMGFYSIASPVWSNFGLERGLPISCFGSYVPDTMQGIIDMHTETAIMSKHGGGTSAYFGDVRSRGSLIRNGENGTSNGAVNFMQMPDTMIKVVSQGSTRRGQMAAYLPAEHGDYDEFLTLHSEGSPIQQLSFGGCFSDDFMNKMLQEEEQGRTDFEATMKNLGLWGKTLEKRTKTGFPYMFFTDNANRGMPQWYKDQGYKILHSNLCTEIMLPNGKKESFVCCLSSINVYLWPEIVKEGVDKVVGAMIWFLDAVMSEFIEKAADIPHMEKAVRFAERHRALGMGVLGWHSYMQRHNLAIDTAEAHAHNRDMFKQLSEAADRASRDLAEMFGEPEVLKGYGRRNTTTMAIAPTKTSSFMIGQMSEGVEPWKESVVVKDTQKGTFTVWNPELLALLARYDRNDLVTRREIIQAGGSVQGLDFLTDHEKRVFRTFEEIPQMELINHAAERQPYIEQGQSLNVKINPKTPAKQISDLHIKAWQAGLKSLYYQKGANAAHQLTRELTACTSCEG